ncbi:pilus assembly protein Flp/PilA [Sphingomonas gellani]|uniref:Pilus assembly protein Flp/PilA n=1 Tax=Sphingomonas gellani TaxID=1166340 RepID=A0A1H7ZLG8_9SPHN|nr:Flp family type IVb pilin [Sphingomonas gellani]SEM58774.1 pilus assembly protein Flp/PilA [Sphingomonas gellani]
MPRRLASDRRGATAVEYALILALIVLVVIAALKQVAGNTTVMWNNVSDQFIHASGRP